MPNLIKSTPKGLPKISHGLQFQNLVGLAAGMDKNAECLLAWQNLGFGFAEVGTVTALPQSGNPKPRLFRLTEDQALFNRMGFNNDGAVVIAKRIEKQRRLDNLKIPIGINIGKSAAVGIEDAAKDYVSSFDALADVADYIAINVSSPNTQKLRELQAIDALSRILEAVGSRNEKRSTQKLIIVKIAPDLRDEDAVAVSRAAMNAGSAGLIVSNTTVQNLGVSKIPEGGGGLSGAPLFEPSTRLLALVREAIGPKPLLIASGGVMKPSDAAQKIRSGANLVQVYSGLVYSGPSFVSQCVQATLASS